MGFDECVMTRTYWYSVIYKIMFSWPYSSPVLPIASPRPPPPSEPLAATDLFTVSIVLHVPNVITLESFKMIGFSDGLLLLPDVGLRPLPSRCDLVAHFLLSGNHIPLLVYPLT